jgi:hypothetical protein
MLSLMPVTSASMNCCSVVRKPRAAICRRQCGGGHGGGVGMLECVSLQAWQRVSVIRSRDLL